MINERDLYWLAGLLEGEGCFAQSGYSSIIVSLHMTDRDVVLRASLLMGEPPPKVGRRRRSASGRKDSWVTRVCGDRAISLMELLLPLMGERRKTKIRNLLNWAKQRPGVYKPLTSHQVQLIRQAHAAGTNLQSELANQFGVSQQTISNVVLRRHYL